jgi:hypothetical protein
MPASPLHIYANGLWLALTREPLNVEATGGTVTDITVDGVDYKVHTFTSSGNFVVTRGGDIEFLIVAGGGGGGSAGATGGGGAGGAGGLITGMQTVTATSYSVIVGAGGASGTGGAANAGTQGNVSSAFVFSATGGGAGGGAATNGGGGGSGGGGGGFGPGSGGATTGGTAALGQGSPGGELRAWVRRRGSRRRRFHFCWWFCSCRDWCLLRFGRQRV